MDVWRLVFVLLIGFVLAHGKIHNILGCNVRDNVIHECDGTETPITEEHERILGQYMDDLAAYYRQQYPTTNAQQDDPKLTQPSYPQLCKQCP